VTSICDVSVLSIPGKILAHVILNRLAKHVIFTAHQLQEQCCEQQCYLCAVFVDLTKAFDKVKRDALWKILKKTGCSSDLVDIM